MRYQVTEEFKTPLHRFRIGDEVEDTDIDGPLTALDWFDKGYLGHIPPAEEDVDALRDEARALGVSFDRRWGAARLREEMERFQAKQQAAAEKAAAAAAEAAVSAVESSQASE